MPLKSYSKTKLEKFKKSIQGRLNDVAHEMDDIKDTLDTNTRGNSGWLRMLFIVCIWQMQAQIPTNVKKDFIS